MKNNYNTVSRTKMLEYLKQNRSRTVSVKDIERYLSENGCDVNISTIYRYIDKLESTKQVKKYMSESGVQAVFQYVEPLNSCEEHIHLQCVKCGSIVHLDCEFMEEFSAHIERAHGFHIQHGNTVIYGLCNKCGPKIELKVKY